ncbi:MAG: hypothetical protein WBA22_16320 [Candidatus Methanofastidiosia archaeon]
MSLKEVLDILGGVFEYFLPLVFGFATLALQTKNSEDEYDEKIKEISIVYNDKFEEKLSSYINLKSEQQESSDEETVKDLEKYEERRYEQIESLLNYASEYRKWTTMTMRTKSHIRNQSFAFLLSGILLTLSRYPSGKIVLALQLFGISLFLAGFLHISYHYLIFRPKLDRKYNQLELRSIKEW